MGSLSDNLYNRMKKDSPETSESAESALRNVLPLVYDDEKTNHESYWHVIADYTCSGLEPITLSL